jgi:Fumarylacetoacetate (FAA) hydrolase family
MAINPALLLHDLAAFTARVEDLAVHVVGSNCCSTAASCSRQAAPAWRSAFRGCWSSSAAMTLRVGDVLLTGTPSGIGNARVPQVFLKPGDDVVTRVSQLGSCATAWPGQS